MKIDANPPSLWQPLTPRGIAALALARGGRLPKFQAAFALLVVGSLVWFVTSAWFPVIDATAHQLPAQAQIRAGALEWTGSSPVRLAENKFLSVTIDPDAMASPHSTTDIEIELGRYELRVRSLLGYLALPYPARYRIDLSRTEFQAWWGAWRPFLLGFIGVFAAVALLLGWNLLALLYAPVVRFIGFYANRAAPFRVCWRLAVAAMMPGAVVLAGVTVLYSLQRIDLIGLLFGIALHLVVGWLFLVVSPLALPQRTGSRQRRRGNPFRR
jgi:hypothetical protein